MVTLIVLPTEVFPFVGQTETVTDSHADFFIKDLVAIRPPRRPAPPSWPRDESALWFAYRQS